MPPGAAVPLTGADCFLRAFDVETRRTAGASHLSQIVLRLGPGLDAAKLRDALHRVARAQPILRAPIRRRGLVGPPVYRLDLAERAPLPTVEVHAAKLPPGMQAPLDGVPLPELAYARMNAVVRARRGELFRADVVEYDGGRGGADVVFTWLHMLLDGHGSERFLAFLDAVASGARDPSELPPGEWEETPVPGTAGERGERARAWQAHVEGFAERAPRSLAGPLRRVRQDLRYPLYTLDAERTAAVEERAAARAGFVTPALFYLAAAIRAHDAVFRARGADPGSYVVPLPVNLRGKGTEGVIFRTRVSMMWFQVAAELASDLDAVVDDLKRQRRDMLRGRMIENGVAAMDFARFAPSRVYSTMARRTFGGELCSFFFAFTGPFLAECDTFLGAPILNGFHAAPVPASPGSAAIMSVRHGRLNVTHVHQRGLLSDEERSLFRERLFGDLLGDEGAA
ncbi:MAG: hypothetical protein ACQGVC_26285 [Myxococcota bacterium]